MSKHRIEQKRTLINLIRSWFTDQGFFELETPILVPSPGMEVHLHGFTTDYVNFHGDIHKYYLPTSPEFSLKKALGEGFDRVFEIARVFRNHGEFGPQHHPEFNMLEWYRPGDYKDIMDDVTALISYLSNNFQNKYISQGFSWDQGVKRSSVRECFDEYCDLDLIRGLRDGSYWLDSARKILDEVVPDEEVFADIFFRIWLKLIEPELGKYQPEIVYDYPASMAALSKIKASDPVWAERFELYIQGTEIGNAFSELTDSNEQRHRFEITNEERAALGYPAHPVDDDLIQSVGQMQETGGIAMGVERLLMVLTGEKDIRECFLQPLDASGAGTKRT